MHIDDPNFSVDILADNLFMSRPVLYKKIHAVSGLSVNDFIKSTRLNKAAELLKQSDENNISEIAYMVGFSDPKYFGRQFRKKFGMSPRDWRKL